jgi:hypothetical protein
LRFLRALCASWTRHSGESRESGGGDPERALREVVFPSLRTLRLCGEILFFYFGCGVTALGPWPFKFFNQMESLAQALIV